MTRRLPLIAGWLIAGHAAAAGLFWALLKIYAMVDRDPPFTTHQLAAMVAPDEFPIVEWWSLFGVPRTSFLEATRETFRGRYADVVLDF